MMTSDEIYRYIILGNWGGLDVWTFLGKMLCHFGLPLGRGAGDCTTSLKRQDIGAEITHSPGNHIELPSTCLLSPTKF